MSNDQIVRRILQPSDRNDGVNAEVVPFSFNGSAFTGVAGEPLAAALIAGGVRVLRTMPKTGEPRGGYCFVGRCADCLVIVDGVPNVRACLEPVREGMNVLRQDGLGENAFQLPNGHATGGTA